ncbi:MAG: hypothetical protein ACLQDM_12305, partial [Bradyrhizobium sp.]
MRELTLDEHSPALRKIFKHNMGGFVMRKVLVATCLASVTAFGASAANANDELNKMSQNPKD